MSRIGLKPIGIGSGVKVSLVADEVLIEGPKGKLRERLPRGISAELAEGQVLQLRRRNDGKRQRSLHGLTRALLANAVRGVSTGFTKGLEIHGVGFAAEVKGRRLELKLGYSHPVVFPLPEGVDVKVERNLVTVGGCNRQQVGQVAADIRALRPPDVYKHKGIRYAGEQLLKKAGKTGAK
jgi:large subunit ribosomal protein L6